MNITTQTKTTWRKVKFGEIVIPKGSVSGPFGSNIHSKFFTREGVPVIRGNNLAIGFNPSRYVDDDYIFLSEQKAEELSKSEALPEDIIVTARGTIGQTGIIPKKSRYKKYILSANQLRFRIDRKIANPLFVYYWLASKMMVRTMQNVSVNVGVPNLNLGNTRNLPVPLPPLPIQERIADILSIFDDKIELNNKISAALEQMAQAIFKERFVNFRFPGSAYTKATVDRHEKAEFADSELGRIPKEWEVRELGEIADVQWGDTSVTKASYVDTGYPAYSASGQDGFRKTYDFDRIGVVLSAIGANCGITWLARDKWSVIKNTIRFWSTNEKVSTEYLFLATLGKETWPQRGSAQPFITMGEARKRKILVPAKNILKQFNDFVVEAYSRIDSARVENQKLASLRDLLLPKLMSGEIRV